MNQSKISRRKLLQRGAVTTAGIAMTTLPQENTPAALPVPATSGDPLATLKPGHPRLHASSRTWADIKARRATDPLLDRFLKRGEMEARAILTVPPMIYKKDGKRLLHVSRVVLRRVLLLGMNYHLTGDSALARRANDEMQAVAAFADWNPSHFLDVGEMTLALAIGYDWLYDQLDEPSRQGIVTAIVEKGLKPGLANDAGAKATNNWNSVCLGGLAAGALAVADREPALARQILEKARANNQNGLRPYAPDGVYPEGAMYWGYGTTFQVVLLDALQTALGTDWGLSKSPGLMNSANAMNQQLGPTGMFFNFSDNVERPGIEPAMWWYAHTLKAPDLLRYETVMLEKYVASTQPPQPMSEANRLMPLAAIWWPTAAASKSAAPLPRSWFGRGPNQLAAFRSAWDDPKAMYLALKAGGASLSHGHMDAGSFIFEANGVRWGCDLGMQDYLSLESKGINLWAGAQTSDRWKIYRLGPFSHSTLTINGELHRADGLATISHFSDKGDTGAIVDLSPVFKTQASRVTRGFVFRPNSHTLIRDEIEGLKPGDTVRWAMLTRADVTVSDDGLVATLRQSGEQLRVSLPPTAGAKWNILPADPPPNDYDAPNPGARLLVASVTVPASGTVNIAVTLQPLSPAKPSASVKEALSATMLRSWPLPPAV
ncbi:MAG: heparinase II/III family protein [Armatimonadota bacterium]